MEKTNGIPICPHCNKPTKRQAGMTMTTAMHRPLVYDEKGAKMSNNNNRSLTSWTCLECNKQYITSGEKYVINS